MALPGGMVGFRGGVAASGMADGARARSGMSHYIGTRHLASGMPITFSVIGDQTGSIPVTAVIFWLESFATTVSQTKITACTYDAGADTTTVTTDGISAGVGAEKIMDIWVADAANAIGAMGADSSATGENAQASGYQCISNAYAASADGQCCVTTAPMGISSGYLCVAGKAQKIQGVSGADVVIEDGSQYVRGANIIIMLLVRSHDTDVISCRENLFFPTQY